MSLNLFLLDVAVKSFAVMFLVTLIAWSCQRKSAAFRHRVWSWGVCGTLAIPLISYVGPAWRVAILPSERVATSVATPVLPSPGAHVSQPNRRRRQNQSRGERRLDHSLPKLAS